MPNSYRNNNGSETWYKKAVITEMTDPGAYMQRSYTLFRFFKDGNNIFQYLPAYWMSKSHVKADNDIFAHDMRHHEIYVVLELVNHLVQSIIL